MVIINWVCPSAVSLSLVRLSDQPPIVQIKFLGCKIANMWLENGNTPVSSVEMPFEGQYCFNMHADGETQMQSCLLKIQRDSKILQQTQYILFGPECG